MVVTSQETEETFTPIPLEKLDMFWLDNGAPVFVGNVPDICKHVEAHGFQIYYVMATEKYEIQDGNFKKTGKRPQVFKVISSIIGKSITEAGDDIRFDELTCNAWFALPKIPYHLIQMMDDFFRLIDEELGTESIVLLTYDSTMSGPEGWGVLVPDQTNTSVDCDYKNESIALEKPDHVYIVGSAHSHPGMPAYASPQDHKDQANFDGLHITFGWMKSKNNGITEFHIELQSGGRTFDFNADQVFESFPANEPSADVKEWAKKVSKKAWSGGTQHSGSQYQGGTTTTPSSPTKKVKVPVGCPDINDNIVIGQLQLNDKKCPFCSEVLISIDRDKRRCMSCHQYLCLEGDSLQDIAEARIKAGVYTVDIDVIKGTPNKPVHMWVRLPDGTDRFDTLFKPSGK